MKLNIDGTLYDYLTALNKVSSHLYDMKIQGDVGKRTVVQSLDLLAHGLAVEEGETDEARGIRVGEMEKTRGC